MGLGSVDIAILEEARDRARQYRRIAGSGSSAGANPLNIFSCMARDQMAET